MDASHFSVKLSEQAEEVYIRLALEAEACYSKGDSTNYKVTRFRMVEDAIERLIPHNPLSRERALSGILSGWYRVKKGRMRICYACDPSEETITIIYISETLRKDGSSNDPYAILTRLVKSGQAEEILKGLGVHKELKQSLALGAHAGPSVQ
jgi:mRNA-degrading endonuclease RelE of RelBE toxin-antitoxin system